MMDTGHKDKNHLCVGSFGVGLGIAEGLYMMVFAWVAAAWGYGASFVHDLAVLMPGYGATFLGGLIGGGWGFLDGFIFGIIASFVYNLCLSCRCCKKECDVHREE